MKEFFEKLKMSTAKEPINQLAHSVSQIFFMPGNFMETYSLIDSAISDDGT